MSSRLFATRPTARVAVLTVDRELAGRLDGARRERAETLSAARVLRRPHGVWDATHDAAHGRDGLGLLVIEGTLVRRVGMGGRFGAEILSSGDLLQPAEHDGEGATLPFEATWRVLTPLRLAVLDLAWMARMSPFPEVFAELTRRVMARSRRLASMQALVTHHRREARLIIAIGGRGRHQSRHRTIARHRPALS